MEPPTVNQSQISLKQLSCKTNSSESFRSVELPSLLLASSHLQCLLPRQLLTTFVTGGRELNQELSYRWESCLMEATESLRTSSSRSQLRFRTSNGRLWVYKLMKGFDDFNCMFSSGSRLEAWRLRPRQVGHHHQRTVGRERGSNGCLWSRLQVVKRESNRADDLPKFLCSRFYFCLNIFLWFPTRAFCSNQSTNAFSWNNQLLHFHNRHTSRSFASRQSFHHETQTNRNVRPKEENLKEISQNFLSKCCETTKITWTNEFVLINVNRSFVEIVETFVVHFLPHLFVIKAQRLTMLWRHLKYILFYSLFLLNDFEWKFG